MKVKCEGYEGELISLYAHETWKCTLGGKPVYTIMYYDITIRTDKSGAQIEFEQVKPGGFEIIIASNLQRIHWGAGEAGTD